PSVRRQASGRLLVAGHHRDAPSRVDRCAVRPLLAIDRMPDPDQPPIRLGSRLAVTYAFEVDRRDRTAQCFRIVATVEMLARYVVEGHLLGTHQVLQPDFMGFDPDFTSNR